MINRPIYTGRLQSDLDFAGFHALNCPDITGGGGGSGVQRKFDVKSYGAAGDGSADDTTAIQAALAAIPATGGVLYFPAGQYEYHGAALTLSKKVTVEGDGGLNQFDGALSVSTIDFNSATGTLFDVKVTGCSFKNIGLRNTSSTVPTAGVGVLVSGSGAIYDGSRTSFESVVVDGFYTCIDVQAGTALYWNNCVFLQPVLYGLKLRNVLLPDGGDHFISNCLFSGSAARAGVSAIRMESGGGTKIVNCKIVSGSNLWTNGIDLAVASAVSTSDLLISNCSIESVSQIGIKGTTTFGATSTWANILITGCQFSQITQFAIWLNASAAGDFDGVALTGNLGSFVPSPSYPMIYCNNCNNVANTGNVMGKFPFSDVTQFVNCTFSRSATIPPGGTTGQVLKKLSNANYDVGWV